MVEWQRAYIGGTVNHTKTQSKKICRNGAVNQYYACILAHRTANYLIIGAYDRLRGFRTRVAGVRQNPGTRIRTLSLVALTKYYVLIHVYISGITRSACDTAKKGENFGLIAKNPKVLQYANLIYSNGTSV